MTCRFLSFSFRFQVKLTVQGEVQNSSTILQQTFVVEYIVNGQMCDECRRVEAKDTWNASVSPILQFKLVLLSNKIHHRKCLIIQPTATYHTYLFFVLNKFLYHSPKLPEFSELLKTMTLFDIVVCSLSTENFCITTCYKLKKNKGVTF